jgi:hypothetical protein
MDADQTFNFLGSWFASTAWSHSPCIQRCDFALTVLQPAIGFGCDASGSQWSLSFVSRVSLGLFGVPLLVSLSRNKTMLVAELVLLPPQLDALDGLILS